MATLADSQHTVLVSRLVADRTRLLVLVPFGLYLLAAGLLLVRIGDHPPYPYNWENVTAREFFTFWDHPSWAIFTVTQGLMTDSGDSPEIALPGWLAGQVAGLSLTALRVPGALLAAGAAPLLWLVGGRLVGRRAAALAAVLLALSPVFLLYGRTATTVGLSLLPMLGTTYALVRLLQAPTRWPWLLALLALLLVDAYFYAPIRFLWPISLILLLIRLVWGGSPRRALLVALVGVAVVPTAAIRLMDRDPAHSLYQSLKWYYNGRGEQIDAMMQWPQEYAANLRLSPAEEAQGGLRGTPQELALRLVLQNTGDYVRLLLDWNMRPALTDYWNTRGRLYPLLLMPFFVMGLVRSTMLLRRRLAAWVLLGCFFGFGLPMLLTTKVHIGRLIFVLPFLFLLVASGLLRLADVLSTRLGRDQEAEWAIGAARRLPALGALALVAVVAWLTWLDYAPDPPLSKGDAAIPVLRDLAATTPHGVSLVLGDSAGIDIETIQAATYRLELGNSYRFVNLAAGPDPGPAAGETRPALYYGALLDRLADPATVPGLCTNDYYIDPQFEERFLTETAAARVLCGAPLRYHFLPGF